MEDVMTFQAQGAVLEKLMQLGIDLSLIHI